MNLNNTHKTVLTLKPRRLLLAALLLGLGTLSAIAQPASYWGHSPSVVPLTFNQLAQSNVVAVYDMTRCGFTVGAAPNTFTDVSPNLYHAIGGNITSSTYATNNAAELNATNYWVFGAGSTSSRWVTNFPSQAQPFTVYMLVREHAFSSTQNYFDSYSGSSALLQISSGPTFTENAGTALTGGAVNANQWYWYECRFNGGSSLVRTNDAGNVLSGNAGANALAGITIATDNTHVFANNMDVAYFSVHTNVPAAFSTQLYTAAKQRFGTQLP